MTRSLQQKLLLRCYHMFYNSKIMVGIAVAIQETRTHVGPCWLRATARSRKRRVTKDRDPMHPMSSSAHSIVTTQKGSCEMCGNRESFSRRFAFDPCSLSEWREMPCSSLTNNHAPLQRGQQLGRSDWRCTTGYHGTFICPLLYISVFAAVSPLQCDSFN